MIGNIKSLKRQTVITCSEDSLRLIILLNKAQAFVYMSLQHRSIHIELVLSSRGQSTAIHSLSCLNTSWSQLFNLNQFCQNLYYFLYICLRGFLGTPQSRPNPFYKSSLSSHAHRHLQDQKIKNPQLVFTMKTITCR